MLIDYYIQYAYFLSMVSCSFLSSDMNCETIYVEEIIRMHTVINNYC